MKVLYCCTFGIGNSILKIPALKALSEWLEDQEFTQLDVLIGNTKDDYGALEVFQKYKQHSSYFLDNIYVNQAPINEIYDIAIESIPYDGRWVNGVHYRAKRVLDGRTRPDPNTTGLSSWEKHEVLYQLDTISKLGWKKDYEFLNCAFFYEEPIWSAEVEKNTIYLGVGYKKTPDYMVKGLSPQFFADLILELIKINKDLRFVTTGDQKDLEMTIVPTSNILAKSGHRDKLMFAGSDLKASFSIVNSCGAYIGTDSGMMHVAASCKLPVVAIFNMQYSIIKNHPWQTRYKVLEGWEKPVTVKQVVDAYLEITNGK